MSLFCQECGNEVASQYRFCPACGCKNLAQGKPAISVQAAAPVYQAPIAPLQPIQMAAMANGILPAQRNFGGFWRRVAAFAIDFVLLNAIWYCFDTAFVFVAPNVGQFATKLTSWILYSLTSWIYSANMESGPHQATWGKRAMGLRVCDLSGNRISFGRASGRFFSSIFCLLSLGVGYVMVAFTKQKQGLHDKMADTLVLRIGE